MLTEGIGITSLTQPGTESDKTPRRKPDTEPVIELIPYDRTYFNHPEKLRQFVRSCTVIVHLAYINRHTNPQTLYDENISITRKLIHAFIAEKANPALIYSSSIRETEDSHYGRSKLHSRLLFQEWAQIAGAPYTGLIVPNIYGPGAKPYYNSFIATFCDQLINGDRPVVTTNREIPLLYIDDFCQYLKSKIQLNNYEQWPYRNFLKPDYRMTVLNVLEVLHSFHNNFIRTGKPLVSEDVNLMKLQETFRSYKR